MPVHPLASQRMLTWRPVENGEHARSSLPAVVRKRAMRQPATVAIGRARHPAQGSIAKNFYGLSLLQLLQSGLLTRDTCPTTKVKRNRRTSK
jgi:hypothetical protein